MRERASVVILMIHTRAAGSDQARLPPTTDRCSERSLCLRPSQMGCGRALRPLGEPTGCPICPPKALPSCWTSGFVRPRPLSHSFRQAGGTPQRPTAVPRSACSEAGRADHPGGHTRRPSHQHPHPRSPPDKSRPLKQLHGLPLPLKSKNVKFEIPF